MGFAVCQNFNRFGKAILDGWQLSGIFSMQSGTPLDIQANAATLRAPGNTQRAIISGTPKILGDIGPGKLYFDTTAFTAPPANEFSPIGRNGSGLTGPGYVNLDSSLIKRFRFTERIGGELRIDALNVTNSPNFFEPEHDVGEPGLWASYLDRWRRTTSAFWRARDVLISR